MQSNESVQNFSRYLTVDGVVNSPQVEISAALCALILLVLLPIKTIMMGERLPIG